MSNRGTDGESSPQVFYEVAMNRLDAQMNRLEAIDRKLGSIIGFASVIMAIFAAALQLGEPAQSPPSAIVFLGLAGVVYIALMVFALRAYRFRKWSFRPNLDDLSERCVKYDDLTMRKWVAQECILSYRKNEETLISKTSDGRNAVRLLFAETTLLIIAVVLALVIS